MLVIRALLLPCLLLTGIGCSGSETEASRDCPGGRSTPISTAQVVAALRERGFSAEADSRRCAGAADIVMAVNNTGRDDEEGHVFCSVRRRPIYGGGFSRLPGTGKSTVWWVQDNVECALYARRNATDEMARLRAALRAMASEVGA